MPKLKQYPVLLADEERAKLVACTTSGVASARELRRARILLLAAENWLDADVAHAVGCCAATVERVRRRCADDGVEAALVDRTRPGAARILDSEQEAILIALACTDGPNGRSTWTMQLLADQLVVLGVVAQISDETVRRTLKKRSQTLATARVVSHGADSGVRVADGSNPRPVCRSPRPAQSGHLS
jgi:transposase